MHIVKSLRELLGHLAFRNVAASPDMSLPPTPVSEVKSEPFEIRSVISGLLCWKIGDYAEIGVYATGGAVKAFILNFTGGRNISNKYD